jgi:hypothetical protein
VAGLEEGAARLAVRVVSSHRAKMRPSADEPRVCRAHAVEAGSRKRAGRRPRLGSSRQTSVRRHEQRARAPHDVVGIVDEQAGASSTLTFAAMSASTTSLRAKPRAWSVGGSTST